MDTTTTEAPAGEVENRLADALGIEDDDAEDIEEVATEEEAPEGDDDERTDEDESEESDEDESEEEAEPDSVTVDGKIIDLPPGTPAEVVEQVQAAIAEKERALTADYTRKTQEAAEMRKGAEAFQQEVQHQAQFNEQHLEGLASLQSMTAQLKQYADVDWALLEYQDPEGFKEHKYQRASLQASHEKLHAELSGRLNEHHAQAQAKAAEVYNYTVNTLREKIPNYGVEVDKGLVKAAVDMGKRYGIEVSVEKLRGMHDPLVWLGLHEVARLQELMTKGAQDKRIPPKPTKHVTPGVKTTKTTESERKARDNLRKTGKGAASLIEKYL